MDLDTVQNHFDEEAYRAMREVWIPPHLREQERVRGHWRTIDFGMGRGRSSLARPLYFGNIAQEKPGIGPTLFESTNVHIEQRQASGGGPGYGVWLWVRGEDGRWQFGGSEDSVNGALQYVQALHDSGQAPLPDLIDAKRNLESQNPWHTVQEDQWRKAHPDLDQSPDPAGRAPEQTGVITRPKRRRRRRARLDDLPIRLDQFRPDPGLGF